MSNKEIDMSANTAARNSFLQRLIGAMALDAAIYEEVEADRAATGQALAVVLLSSLAAGVGVRGFARPSVATVVFMSTISLVAWVAWALLTFEIGGRLIPEPQTRVDAGELLRTIGFASAPGLLRVLGIIPNASIPVFVGTALWMVVATIVAVRQALDYKSTARAIAVCVLGWLLATAMAAVLGLFFGPALS
ncbi:MAG TPA: hypothetical protein VIW45_08595 [Vicinamibacterales bacterium]